MHPGWYILKFICSRRIITFRTGCGRCPNGGRKISLIVIVAGWDDECTASHRIADFGASIFRRSPTIVRGKSMKCQIFVPQKWHRCGACQLQSEQKQKKRNLLDRSLFCFWLFYLYVNVRNRHDIIKFFWIYIKRKISNWLTFVPVALHRNEFNGRCKYL